MTANANTNVVYTNQSCQSHKKAIKALKQGLHYAMEPRLITKVRIKC